MFLSFLGEMLLYFDLLVSESGGVFYFLPQYIRDYFPFFVALFLFGCVILARIFHFEDDLLGYGILTMIAFCFFILWIILDRKKGPN